ncbi:MAG: LemA family protein [Candidatus Cryptobacteroides sp.]
MKKGLIIAIALVAVLVLYGINTYNRFVTGEESVKSAWSQVENVYQRRSDLIPNLVSTVKGYAKHESNTLQAVIEARANASRMTVDPSKLSKEQIAQFQSAQSELSNAIGRLLVTVEQYPDLKANQNFLDLQAQLEGTENRITVERNKFNETVKAYNTSIKRFPGNIIASIFRFEEKGYFQASEEAKTAPKVEF